MAHTGYWIAAVDGDTITDKIAHADRDCAEDAGAKPSRPVSDTRVKREDMDLCTDCTGNSGGSDDAGDASAEAEGDGSDGDGDDVERVPGEPVCTCDVGEACNRCGGDCPMVKSDGEVCGRELPCRYHS